MKDPDKSSEDSSKSTFRDLMFIELLFGNQNIKEDKISRLESTSDFIDQELNFKFRPMSCIFRKEFLDLVYSFL